MTDARAWAGFLLVATLFVSLFIAERVRPLRGWVEPDARRIVRNLTLGAIWTALLTALQAPLLVSISGWAVDRHLGLLHLVPLPAVAETVIAVVLLDYTLWFWHWANHRIPFLWRFHLVHHVDLDLDTSTALRFHAGEMLMSILYRVAQMLVIGADVTSVNVFQYLLLASILFHHSNVRLPYALERRLVRALVTPRMHGIHHSTRERETNSNYSSLISVWDRWHGTLRLNVPQSSVRIGVPAYQSPADTRLVAALVLPLRERVNDWSGPRGAVPPPVNTAAPPSVLLD